VIALSTTAGAKFTPIWYERLREDGFCGSRFQEKTGIKNPRNVREELFCEEKTWQAAPKFLKVPPEVPPDQMNLNQ
jgi:hypothetical protein